MIRNLVRYIRIYKNSFFPVMAQDYIVLNEFDATNEGETTSSLEKVDPLLLSKNLQSLILKYSKKNLWF